MYASFIAQNELGLYSEEDCSLKTLDSLIIKIRRCVLNEVVRNGKKGKNSLLMMTVE